MGELSVAEERVFGKATSATASPRSFSNAAGDLRPSGRPIPERGNAGQRGDPGQRGDSGQSERSRGSRALPLMVAFLALAAFAGIVWYAYNWGVGGGAPAGLPVVEAPEGPEKVPPSEPGGLQVPHQDKQLLNQGEKASTDSAVERLLPPPEEPLPPEPAVEVGQAGVAAGSDLAAPATGTFENPATMALDSSAMEPLAPEEPKTANSSQDPAQVVAAAPEPQKPSELSKTAPAAAPTAAPAASPAEAPTAAPATTTQTAAVATGGGYFVQLLSVKDQAGAQGAWSRLQGKFPSLLGSASSKIERADLGDRGTFYRLLTGPLPSEAAASKLCGDLKAKGQACLVKKP